MRVRGSDRYPAGAYVQRGAGKTEAANDAAPCGPAMTRGPTFASAGEMVRGLRRELSK
jgi:hypothetical protein